MSLRCPVRVFSIAALAMATVLGACSRPPTSGGLPSDALDHAIADRIGDPDTCVLLAERATGKVVYRYGQQFNCVRGLPACDRAGYLTATNALQLAMTPGGRGASCPSSAYGARMVGWAEGRVPSQTRDLVYSAVMEGETALPGHEMAERLNNVFARVKL
jgi:hypothetical protein